MKHHGDGVGSVGGGCWRQRLGEIKYIGKYVGGGLLLSLSLAAALAAAAEVMVINDMIGNHMPQVQVTQKLMAVRRYF